ncbi:Fic family protein [bacterium]|nr:Fic family protein [bacterium]
MPEKGPYEADFEKYLRHTSADKKEKTFAWATAIGLQQVDGLKPSEYLYQTAKRNIEGEISFDDVSRLINSYYKSKSLRLQNPDNRTEEADKVSSRIAQILSEPSFNFSPSYLIAVHKRLFDGIFKFAGRLRDYDITKNEWVLNGDTVMYGAAFELKSALEYDFMQEKKFRYKNLSMDEIVRHITFFVSRLWQIHAFGEGNTRTTAVFTIKYLRSLGFKADNDIFAQNSWYFRNALVRANYTNLQKGISENHIFLEKFFRNLLLDEHNKLKNRETHIDYAKYAGKFRKKLRLKLMKTSV